MNYKIENETYIADNGYVFKNKITGSTAKGLTLGVNDSIENYEIIEEPIEEVIEPTHEELLEMYKNQDL